MSNSIFSNRSSFTISNEPYVHASALGNALSGERAQALLARYPTAEDIIKNTVYGRKPTIIPGRKICCYAVNVLKEGSTIDPLWQEFVREHFSYDGFMDFTSLFGDQLYQNTPLLKEYLKGITKDDVGLAHAPEHVGRKIVIDGGVCIDVPDLPGGTARIHLDTPYKIGGGLYYVRDEKNTGGGGEFNILVPKQKVHTDTKYVVFESDAPKMEVVKSVPYTHNSAIAFLNSPLSFHAIAPHFNQSQLRYSVVISYNVTIPLFDYSHLLEPVLIRKARGLLKLFTKKEAGGM